MVTITKTHIARIYQNAIDVNNGIIHQQVAKINVIQSGMDSNSAGKYFVAIDAMFNGIHYGSTINATATDYFWDNIRNDFGTDGLEKALRALKSHIDYQEGRNHLPSLKKIYNRYMETLDIDFPELALYTL